MSKRPRTTAGRTPLAVKSSAVKDGFDLQQGKIIFKFTPQKNTVGESKGHL